MKKLLRRIAPQPIRKAWSILKSFFIDIDAIISYAQEGEDIILRRIFENRARGFYIDVGAHHPRHYSNTYYFYKIGWSGVNIDASPGSMNLFRRLRPRDTNIELAIGAPTEKNTFFLFNDPALNTFDPKLAHARNTGIYHIIKEQDIPVLSLAEVLAQYVPANKHIDFLSVDAEGMDLSVLQSNNWKRFRPEYVLVECLDVNPGNLKSDLTYRFMLKQEYEFFAKTVNTLFFKNRVQ